MSVEFRGAFAPGDIGALTRLHGELYAREYGYGVAFEGYCAQGIAEVALAFDTNRDRVWLCDVDGTLAGSLMLAHRDRGCAQLRFFLLAPVLRGQGLGKRLMAEYMAALATLGYSRSYLWTTNDLPVAASLYTRHGFQLTESVPSTRFGKALVEQRYDLSVG
ncbi:MAG: GNAT family N-acetyltransferase [Gammaproteobacteria bacterium]